MLSLVDRGHWKDTRKRRGFLFLVLLSLLYQASAVPRSGDYIASSVPGSCRTPFCSTLAPTEVAS